MVTLSWAGERAGPKVREVWRATSKGVEKERTGDAGTLRLPLLLITASGSRPLLFFSFPNPPPSAFPCRPSPASPPPAATCIKMRPSTRLATTSVC